MNIIASILVETKDQFTHKTIILGSGKFNKGNALGSAVMIELYYKEWSLLRMSLN